MQRSRLSNTVGAFQLPRAVGPPTLLFVGTDTRAKSKGIYSFRLQREGTEVRHNVTLVPLGLAVETQNPTFFELDEKRRLLFAVNEMEEFEGKPTGAVSAFSIEASGKLTLVSQRPSMGTGPCHLTLDKEGRNLLVANFVSGTVAVLPVAADGKLGEASDVVQHSGKSVHPERQNGPHPHCVKVDPGNRFAYVCDIGLDKIMAYRFDAEKGKLTPNDPAFTAAKAGTGPRRMMFRQDGRFAYVLNELTSTISTFGLDEESGRLTELQTLSTLPGYYDGPNAAAEMEIHPNGKHLYTSNRGQNSVVQFRIDAAAGTLSWVEEQSMGKTPRHVAVLSLGTHMAIASHDSNEVVAARVDPTSGRVYPSWLYESVPSPACLRFLPLV